jgi:hypothetical protein
MPEPIVDWRSIVTRGIESDELDYKAAQNWRDLSRQGKAKFVRHCLALANTKGGYVVVGVGEDLAGKPSLFTGVSPEQAKSFDPTDVGSFVNRYCDPPIDFDIVRPEIDGKTYVIIVIRRFRELPHVCSHNCNNELQQGGFYIRTANASSRVAYRASEIHGIVQRALRNQREILGRMLRGILYEKGDRPEPISDSLFDEQVRHAEGFLHRNARKCFQGHPLFEVRCQPSEFFKDALELKDVRAAVEDSLISFHDQPLMIVDDPEETYFTNISLRSLSTDRGVYFQAFRSGLYHYVNRISESDTEITYDELLRLVAESMFFLANYYSLLNVEDDVLRIQFRLSGVDGVMLKMRNKEAKGKQGVCRIPEIQIDMERTVADLASGIPDHARRIFRELCVRFNLPDGWHRNIKEMIQNYLDRRI